jgi:signal transduction histidine kinase
MMNYSENLKKSLRRALQASVPIVAFVLFSSVALASFVHGAKTKNSVETFRENVLGQSVTSNDSALASAIVALKLSEYLSGKDIEDQLRARIDVVSTQLALGATNFTGIAVDHTRMSQEAWEEVRIGLTKILNGERDPQIIDSTFENIETTRIHAKRAADAWITQVLSKNLNDAHDQLDAQVRFFSLFAPIAALGALAIIALAIRSRGRTKLEAENEQLTKINNEKTQFVTQVSHELKTPLTSVIAFTDMLIGKSDRPLSVRQSDQLKVVKRNAEYLRLLVNDLIDVSQLETGHISIDPKPISVSYLMSELRSSFGPIVERKQQMLIIGTVSETLKVNGDHLRLLQVLSNLVGNATKYSEAGTTINVTTNIDESHILISAVDQGERMSDADKKRAFEMFFRGSSKSAKRESGTGIGLAVSKFIVEAHHGSIVMENGYLVGTRVVIRLPRPSSANGGGIGSLFVTPAGNPRADAPTRNEHAA